MLVSEIFKSIQGESTFAGRTSVFIRLAGCNLDCAWCDTGYAKADSSGKIDSAFEISVDEIIKEATSLNAPLITITGGEPLLQDGCEELIIKLLALALAPKPLNVPRTVMLETNGSIDLKQVDSRVVKIIDVKCPSSGVSDSFKFENLLYVNPKDEIKFVISDHADYEFARGFVDDHLSGIWEEEVGKQAAMRSKDSATGTGIQVDGSKILFSPILDSLKASELADWIIKDHLNVRLQIQLHKIIWDNETRGV